MSGRVYSDTGLPQGQAEAKTKKLSGKGVEANSQAHRSFVLLHHGFKGV